MGHPAPFDLRHAAVGNEDCTLPHYKVNYPKFYNAIKLAYPDVKVISNCDGSGRPLPHPADFYDYHIYAPALKLFHMAHTFDQAPRLGPKAFVSEYAVTGPDAKTGSLLAALGEAAFLIGLEKNSDLVEMASYAPIFVNVNDRRWNPDAIPFNSSHSYGTPSYYMQQFFSQSNGATLLSSALKTTAPNLIASAITWDDSGTGKLKVKVVNFDSNHVSLNIVFNGGDSASTRWYVVAKTELTSGNCWLVGHFHISISSPNIQFVRYGCFLAVFVDNVLCSIAIFDEARSLDMYIYDPLHEAFYPKMGSWKDLYSVAATFLFVAVWCTHHCHSFDVYSNETSWLRVDASEGSGRKIPDTLFGIFFEEINHAGSGGIWGELVSNRGRALGHRPDGPAIRASPVDEDGLREEEEKEEETKINLGGIALHPAVSQKGDLGSEEITVASPKDTRCLKHQKRSQNV
uniref:non-reducing end alpha-L-arabinofuranosidase n=1 Tax=Kalanchoe fedtschenkoi TaxID=63787 RepID=A0A7N0U905_KALFE